MHFSTDYVFPGTAEDMKRYANGYSEDHPVQPINVYGESKLEGEEAIRASGCDFVILRVSWLCGRYGHNFVKTMLKLGGERDELSVVNDQFGCPTFAQNVVENSWQLLEHNRSGTYHLSSIGKISWYHFAKEIFRQADIKVNLKQVPSSAFPTKAKRPAFSLLNTQKIATISGVTMIDWKEGLTNLLAELN
jgi:dTDP-4-dehydrorhamnose reductase